MSYDFDLSINALYEFIRKSTPNDLLAHNIWQFLQPQDADMYAAIEHKSRIKGGKPLEWFMLHFNSFVDASLNSLIEDLISRRPDLRKFKLAFIQGQNHISIYKDASYDLVRGSGTTTQSHLTFAYNACAPGTTTPHRCEIHLYFNNFGQITAKTITDHETGSIILDLLDKSEIVADLIAALQELIAYVNEDIGARLLSGLESASSVSRTQVTPKSTTVLRSSPLPSPGLESLDSTGSRSVSPTISAADKEIIDNCYRFFNALLINQQDDAFKIFSAEFADYKTGPIAQQAESLKSLVKSMLSKSFSEVDIYSLIIPFIQTDVIDAELTTLYMVDLMATVLCDLNAKFYPDQCAEFNRDIRSAAIEFKSATLQNRKEPVFSSDQDADKHKKFVANLADLKRLHRLENYLSGDTASHRRFRS